MKPTTTLASTVTTDGSLLVLQERDGQYYLRMGGKTLMSSAASASEQTMAELGCSALLEQKPRVLIGGLGFGFTLRRTLELVPAQAEVVVAELLPVVVVWNREHLAELNGALLDDPRVRLVLGDVVDRIAEGERRPFDAILLDVDNSPDPLVQRSNGRLYSPKGIARIRQALAPGGRAVFWSANTDRDFEALLRRHFSLVSAVPAKAYPGAKSSTHTLFVADR